MVARSAGRRKHITVRLENKEPNVKDTDFKIEIARDRRREGERGSKRGRERERERERERQ